METTLSKEALLVAKGAATDTSRPALAAVHIGNGEIATADGFILVRRPIETKGDPILVPAEDVQKSKPMQYAGVIVTTPDEGRCKLMGKQTIESTLVNATFPNYHQLSPTGEPVFSIALGKSVLKKLLACVDEEMVRFEFYGASKPTNFYCGETHGTLMPMYHKPYITKEKASC